MRAQTIPAITTEGHVHAMVQWHTEYKDLWSTKLGRLLVESPKRLNVRRLRLEEFNRQNDSIPTILLEAIAMLGSKRGLSQLNVRLGSSKARFFCSVSKEVDKSPLGFTLLVNPLPVEPIQIRDGCMAWEWHSALMYTLLAEDLLINPDLYVQQYGGCYRISANQLIGDLVHAQKLSKGYISFGAAACPESSDVHWKLAEALTAFAYEYSPTHNGHADNPFYHSPQLYASCNRYYNATLAAVSK
ncbi:MAG: hypothetical protein AAB701_01995 [Patescibacteria group bacterium]